MQGDTEFQREWRTIADQYDLMYEAPFMVETSSGEVTVPVLLRDFGAPLGMLLVNDFSTIEACAEELVDQGYGFSCLSTPRKPFDLEDREELEALHDMLSDWGWSANREPPGWLTETRKSANKAE